KSATSDILNALLALGYNDKEALATIKLLPKELSVSEGIRQSLKFLSKN
ncbi:MAG: Holliday junction branch migration protein RuvA, partial [Methylotenera sp.]